LQAVKIPTANFVYQKAKFNHDNWIKEIMDSSELSSFTQIIIKLHCLTNTFLFDIGSDTLSYHEHEVWYCEDVFNMESAKKQASSVRPIIPITHIKDEPPHQETTLFGSLISLIKLLNR
jgi:hypothetical protein